MIVKCPHCGEEFEVEVPAEVGALDDATSKKANIFAIIGFVLAIYGTFTGLVLIPGLELSSGIMYMLFPKLDEFNGPEIIFLSLAWFFGAIAVNVVALIFTNKVRKLEFKKRSLAKAGFILSIVGLAVSFIMTVILFLLLI